MLGPEEPGSAQAQTDDRQQSHHAIPLQRKATQRNKPGAGVRIAFEGAAGAEPQAGKLMAGKLDDALGEAQFQEDAQCQDAAEGVEITLRLRRK